MTTAPTTHVDQPPSDLTTTLEAALTPGWSVLHDRQVHPGDGALAVEHLLLAPGHVVLAASSGSHRETARAARATGGRLGVPVTAVHVVGSEHRLTRREDGVWLVPAHRLPGWLATRPLERDAGPALALALRLPTLLPRRIPPVDPNQVKQDAGRRRAALQLAATLLLLVGLFVAASFLAAHTAPA